jgi:hypothetical protein
MVVLFISEVSIPRYPIFKALRIAALAGTRFWAGADPRNPAPSDLFQVETVPCRNPKKKVTMITIVVIIRIITIIVRMMMIRINIK